MAERATETIAIIGGTGAEGRGLGLRWAKAGHRVTLGSRDAARARSVAAEVSERAGVEIAGAANADAVAGADIAVLSVPYKAHRATLEGLTAALAGKVLVDITVPLVPPKVRRVQLPAGTAAALEAQAIVGGGVTVVAAFHHVSATLLEEPDAAIDCDVLVCSDDRDARARVVALAGDLPTRGVDAGVLANAVALESLTPVLIHINKRYSTHGSGIRITGIEGD